MPNCDDIFTLICMMLGGNTIPVLTLFQIMELNILTLFYSIGISSYAIPNYQNMNPKRRSKYSNNYNNLWTLYLVGIIIHIFNVVLYIIKFFLLIKISFSSSQKKT